MRKTVLHLLLIAAVGLAAYSNTFRVPFVFDDLSPESGITGSPVIKDINSFISNSRGYDYNPRRFVGYFSFALNYRFGGLDVTGYHIVNVAIHVINAILVYFLVILTFRTPYFMGPGTGDLETDGENQASDISPLPSPQFQAPAFVALFSALLFVSHPVQTQAVTYIVQRFASLAAMLYILSIVMYIKGRMEVRGRRSEGSNLKPLSSILKPLTYYGFSLLFAVLAVKTKETAFTLPLIILLYEAVFFGFSRKKALIMAVPLLLLLTVIAGGLIQPGTPGEILAGLSEKTRVQSSLPRLEYLTTQMRVITTYIRLLFLPVNQNLYYDYPVYRSLFDPPVLFSFLFLSALLGTAVYLLIKTRFVGAGLVPAHGREGQPRELPLQSHFRLIAFGILWFFTTLSVESSVIPIADVIFEHRVYLPSVGAFIALAVTAVIFAERAGRGLNSSTGLNRFLILPGLSIVVIVLLSIATFARNWVWRSETALMEDVVRKSPYSAEAHNGLGHAYLAAGGIDRAIESFRTAASLKPDYALAHSNLGVAYGKRGMYEDAVREFEAALMLEPKNPGLYNNLAVVYRKMGMPARELEYLLIALALKPDMAVVHFNLGSAYEARGWMEKAREHFAAARSLDPDRY